MKTVYVVTVGGAYGSDFSVLAIFPDEESAKNACEVIASEERCLYPQVEEMSMYEKDELPKRLDVWQLRFYLNIHETGDRLFRWDYGPNPELRKSWDYLEQLPDAAVLVHHLRGFVRGVKSVLVSVYGLSKEAVKSKTYEVIHKFTSNQWDPETQKDYK